MNKKSTFQRLSVLCALMFLTACGAAHEPTMLGDAPINIDVSSVGSELVTPLQLDENCGPELPPCGDGLVCVKYNGIGAFICKVRDQKPDLVCDAGEWDVVCAERDGVQNTYQNACYADKAGATQVSEGRCES